MKKVGIIKFDQGKNRSFVIFDMDEFKEFFKIDPKDPKPETSIKKMYFEGNIGDQILGKLGRDPKNRILWAEGLSIRGYKYHVEKVGRLWPPLANGPPDFRISISIDRIKPFIYTRRVISGKKRFERSLIGEGIEVIISPTEDDDRWDLIAREELDYFLPFLTWDL